MINLIRSVSEYRQIEIVIEMELTTFDFNSYLPK